jgi:hypothetical protein
MMTIKLTSNLPAFSSTSTSERGVSWPTLGFHAELFRDHIRSAKHYLQVITLRTALALGFDLPSPKSLSFSSLHDALSTQYRL